ncbi:MAG TPA: RagB/SusD family nutrient uptake outer membrane protein [Sphingobacterium sp.]|nr:RagB/SusD family nutrient uptake outer membrane protein [Sphingobacterium sp.]
MGCKDQLTLMPEDTLSPNNYFSSREELRLWTNQFYGQLDEADELAGQNADDHVDNSLGALILGQRDAASETGWNWSLLRSINYYLQNSSNCADLEARKQYDGVAYFMRAYFYFNKVRRFGDVPWYDQVLSSSDDELLFKLRDNRTLVMDSVMADLDRAIGMLPIAKSVSTVTRWTALALKTRAALFEGTYRKYRGIAEADKYLLQAVQAGDEFITNSGYTLYKATSGMSYRELFVSDDAIAQEVILARIYSSTVNLMHGIQFNIINSKQGMTKRFMNHYLMKDGTRFTEQQGWQQLTYSNEFGNRDPRMAQTILHPGYKQIGSTQVTKNQLSSATGYQPIKFVSSSAFSGASKGVSDFPLFRAAEVYLNFAEAKAELGTLTQGDLDKSINKIRERAEMASLQLNWANQYPDELLLTYYPQVSKDNMKGVILEIRRERTVELVMEGFRQWDIIRWHEGQQLAMPYYGCYFPGPGRYDMDNDGVDDLVLWTGVKESIANGVSKEIGVDIILSQGTNGYVIAYPTVKITWNDNRDYLWPIPTSERVLSGGRLVQNPGWEDSSGF